MKFEAVRRYMSRSMSDCLHHRIFLDKKNCSNLEKAPRMVQRTAMVEGRVPTRVEQIGWVPPWELWTVELTLLVDPSE